MAEIGVIGAGSWGTALAVVLAHNGHNVTVWSILEEEVEMLTREHEHTEKLPGVKIPESVTFTTDLKSAAEGKEMAPMQAVRRAFHAPRYDPRAAHISRRNCVWCSGDARC